MPLIGARITVAQQAAARHALTHDSAELLGYMMRRHSDVMQRLDPEISDAFDYALLFGSDDARKACIEYLLDQADPSCCHVRTEQLYGGTPVWSELHFSTPFDFAAA